MERTGVANDAPVPTAVPPLASVYHCGSDPVQFNVADAGPTTVAPVAVGATGAAKAVTLKDPVTSVPHGAEIVQE